MKNYPASFYTSLTITGNAYRCKGKKEEAPSVGKVGWFNAGKHSPTRDGYYEFRGRGYRVTRDKWSHHPRTDGYWPVFFDAEFGFWELMVGGIGVVVLSANNTEFMRAFEWRGLSESEYLARGGKHVPPVEDVS